MSRARDLAALVTPNLFNQNAGRDQVGLGTSSIGAKIQVGGAVSATTYYGDGSNLTGIALSAASSQQITNLNVTGIATFNQVFISAGGTVYGGDFNNTILTGVTTVNGQISAGGSIGQDGQVLVSTGLGFAWRDPVGVRTEVFITAGIGSTEFNFQHDPNDLDVFVNGIKLQPSDYSSDGGTKVSLAASTSGGESINLVGYGVSGYVGQQGSLTVRGNGTNVGNVGGIRIIDFRGQDISVTGGGTSVSVNIPPRKGIVNTRNTRSYIAHENVGAGQTQYSFLGIASSDTYDNIDVFVNGYKKYIDEVNFVNPKYIGLTSNPPVGGDVIGIGYASNSVRTGIASTAVQNQVVFLFSGTGIGTPGRINSGRPIDVYYRGIKLVENETYFRTYGDAIILNPGVNVFESDIIDIFSYVDQAKVGIATLTAEEETDIISFPQPISEDSVDLIVNGIKQPYSQNVGITSVVLLAEKPTVPAPIVVNSYVSNAKLGIKTEIVGVGETIHFGTLEDEHFVNGVKLINGRIESVGVSSIVALSNIPQTGSIAENIRYATDVRVAISTITSASIGQTVFTDLSSTFSKNNVDVFFNGVKLTAAEFSIVGTSSTVTLTDGSGSDSIGDILEVVQWNAGARYGITTFTAGAGQTNFTVGIPTGVPDNDVYLNGVKLDSGGVSPEYTVVGLGNTIQLSVGAEAGDIIEVIGISTNSRIINRDVTGDPTLNNYIFDIDDYTGSQETFVNGVRVLGAERQVYAPNTFVILSVESDIDSVGVTSIVSLRNVPEPQSITENIRYTTGSRSGIATISATSIGQTVFTANSSTTFAASDVDVFFNGIKLTASEFSIVGTSNTVTLSNGVGANDVGDILEVIKWNAGARYGITTFTAGAGQTDFVVGIPTGVPDNDVFVNGVKLDSGGVSPEYTILGSGSTIQLSVGTEAGDIVEVVGIKTSVRTIDRHISNETSSSFYVFDIDDHTGDQETYVNGVRVLGAERETYGPNEYVFLRSGAAGDGAIYETFRYADYARVGISSFIISGTGTTSVTIESPNGVPDNDVYINGVLLTPSSDYTVEYTASGITTIGFSTSLSINDIIEVVGIATTARVVNTHTSTLNQNVYEIGYYDGENEIFINGIRQQQSGISSTYNAKQYVILEEESENLSINDEVEAFTYASWARVGVTTFTATEGQTTFTVGIPTGVPDNDVFVNGVKLSPSSFTVIGGGSTISLAQSTFAGSYVEIVGIATTARSGIRTEYSAATDGQSIIPVDDASGNIEIYVNGVRYSNSQFIVDSDDEDLRIDVNPSSENPEAQAGDHLEIIEYNSDLSQLGRTSANYRAFAGQTEFQVAYDDKKLLDIFVNGLLLSPSEYTAETGSNIILNNPLLGGELVELISYVGTNVADWIKTSVGIYNTSRYVGVGTDATNYQLEVGYPGIAGTTLWVHGDARVTGILSVGQGTIAIDGNKNEIRVGTGLIINSASGIITATSFVGNLTGTATTAQGLTTSASVDTTGIITATTFYGNLVGNVTGQADTVLGIGTTASINTSGIITATKLRAGVGSFGDAVFGGFGYAGIITARRLFGNVTGDVTGTATGLTTTTSINTVGIITASSFVGALTGNVTGTATTATTALSLSTDVNINTTGIVTAGIFAGNLAGTASTATLALGFSTTASINTLGIITASAFNGELIGNVQGTASIAQVALALTTTADATINSLVVSGVSTFQSNVSLGDNDKILLGNDGDFEITFDSSNAIFQNKSGNTGGDIYIRSDEILIQKYDGSQTIAQFTEGAGVELNWVGVTKFATSNTGASVFGDLSVSGSVTASQFNGLATGLTTATSLNLTGIITAAAFVSDGDVSLIGDNNILGIGTGYRVGVGTLTPAADAILDLKSTTQVFLPPRMTAAQRNSIGSTSTGAIIFNTDSGRHQGYDGSAWNDFYL